MTNIDDLKTKKAFQEAKKGGPLLIDFYTTWCGPCKKQAEVISECKDDLITAHPQLSVFKINIECDRFFEKLADKLGIRSIPQLALFNGNGSVHMMRPGVKYADDIKKFLKEYLN